MIRHFTFLASAICAVSCMAQSISVKDGSEKFSSGSHEALTTTISENTADRVMSEWKSVMKDYKHEKVKQSGDEVFADNILIKEWGNNPVDVYAKFNEDKKDRTVKMAVAVDLGGAYLTSADKEKQRYMEKLMKDFAVRLTKEPIAEGLKEQTKALEKLDDQQKHLEKEKKNLQEDIVNYKNKINKAEKDLVQKKTELEKKKQEVSVQKKVVDASSDAVSEQAKSSKKIYEKLQDQQKDIEKDIRDLENDVKDYSEKVKNAEKDIKTNDENQAKKKEEIEKQKKVVEEWKLKLDKVN